MDKNWLIRTKSNHILGPVSKDKVLELYRNGTIKADDEVCSGNGYWFFIREEDLVEKYLIGSEVQGFNPISEAKDVLTATSFKEPQVDEDITLIGSINTSLLKPESQNTSPESSPATAAQPTVKKKSRNQGQVRRTAKVANKPLKKQNYLRYIGILCFTILFLLIYFRKNIIRSLFEGEMTFMSLVISSAHAQDIPQQKKKITERSLTLEEIDFFPSIGLSGLRVSTRFDVMQITCEDLSNEVVQLGIILYPPDVFHEKFLLRMRECSQKLKDEHPVKRWLKWVSSSRQVDPKDQKMMTFLSEILNSKFNLITDVKVKKQIIEVLTSIPGDDLAEEILQSYLYLMIGNVSRSDNILRTIINRPPYENWKGFSTQTSVYHRVVRDNLSQIFLKLSRHPSDRKTYELFGHYLQEFFNDVILLERLSHHESNSVDGKWAYKVVTRIAEDFSSYVRLSRLAPQKRINRIKRGDYGQDFLAYWTWYFFPVAPLITEEDLKVLNKVEEKDPLWLIYLLENEKLADLYISKKSGNHLAQTRSQLRSFLDDKELFMLSLYKLIDLGDIDEKLVQETLNFLIHE